MKLTHAAGYAVHAAVYLAAHGRGRLATGQEIARECHLPEKYLPRILGRLSAAGTLRTLRGPTGGYRLARPAPDITLLEIVEAVEGPVRGDYQFGERTDLLGKKLQAVCDRVALLARERLGKVRLSDLAGGK